MNLTVKNRSGGTSIHNDGLRKPLCMFNETMGTAPDVCHGRWCTGMRHRSSVWKEFDSCLAFHLGKAIHMFDL